MIYLLEPQLLPYALWYAVRNWNLTSTKIL